MKKINSPRYLFLLGLMTFILVVIVLVSVELYQHFYPLTKKLPDAGSALNAKVDPSLTSFDRGKDIQKLNDESENKLHSYGWINKDKGIVHIPIKRAMELYLNQQSSKK